MSQDNPFESPHSSGLDPNSTHFSPGKPHRATFVLVLGILGIVVCPLTGVAAWVMGKSDLAEMDAGRMDRSGRDLTKAGYIIGIVATCIMLVQFLAMCVWLGFLFTMGAAAGF